MLRPVFSIETESKQALKATVKALLLKEGPHGTEDARLIVAIKHELTSRALGLVREDGWPTALDDPKDDGLPW